MCQPLINVPIISTSCNIWNINKRLACKLVLLCKTRDIRNAQLYSPCYGELLLDITNTYWTYIHMCGHHMKH